jgi:hypothetical protein
MASRFSVSCISLTSIGRTPVFFITTQASQELARDTGRPQVDPARSHLGLRAISRVPRGRSDRGEGAPRLALVRDGPRFPGPRPKGAPPHGA